VSPGAIDPSSRSPGRASQAAPPQLRPWQPIRFIDFSFVGGVGLPMHLLVLGGRCKVAHLCVLAAPSEGTVVATSGDFVRTGLMAYA
jgi:hypothetical protein